MQAFRVLVSCFIFVLMLSALAFAQTEKAQFNALTKIGFINSEAFTVEENGINELVAAYDKLETEFKVEFEQLKSLSEVILDRQEEINELYKVDFRVCYPLEFLKSYKLKLKNKSEELELLVSKYKENWKKRSRFMKNVNQNKQRV